MNLILNLISFVISLAFMWVIIWVVLRFVCSPIVAKWFTHGFVISILFASILSSLLLTSLKLLNVENAEYFLKAIVFSVLAGINVAVIPVFYWYDKRLSNIENSMRIPEKVLHGFAFLGGAASAILVQRLFKHKTAKIGFQRITWCAVVPTFYIFYILLIEWNIK